MWSPLIEHLKFVNVNSGVVIYIYQKNKYTSDGVITQAHLALKTNNEQYDVCEGDLEFCKKRQLEIIYKSGGII